MKAATGPLFKWFGSKWSSARLLPQPAHNTIVEPFAGGAGYSLRHSTRAVVLCEADVHVARLWAWLIAEATSELVREIPLSLPVGTDIRGLGLSDGQALLLKSWQRTNNVGDCWTISPWGDKPGQWTANTRARVAEQIHHVKHWRFAGPSAFEFMARENPLATWLIDPPYLYNYGYRRAPIDYECLAVAARSRNGQVIVCEAAHPKTGAEPDWLPFSHFGDRITSRRKTGDHHHSRELIWQSEGTS